MTQEINDAVSYLMALKGSQPSSTTESTAGAATATARQEPATPSAQVSGAGAETGVYRGAEKRRSARLKCEGSAEICASGTDVRTWARFTDVSLHGCYVEAQATFPAGTKLHLKLEANGIRFETEGNVRVSYPYLGMGIAFENISEESRKNLRELLGTLTRPTLLMGPGVAAGLSASGGVGAVPLITDPGAAIQELVKYFETRHMLTREDFLATLVKSQAMARQTTSQR